jgi:hypothetical protein
MLGLRDQATPMIQNLIDKGSDDPFALYQAWRSTGDTAYLERVYSDEITTAEQRMWMVTEAHWWSDRVELFSDILQRSRLGGMALRRNQMFPGHLVSWRFDTPTAAEDIGILVTGGQKSFKVTGYNLTGQPLHAVMTGWDVAAGQWSVTRAVEGRGRTGRLSGVRAHHRSGRDLRARQNHDLGLHSANPRRYARRRTSRPWDRPGRRQGGQVRPDRHRPQPRRQAGPRFGGGGGGRHGPRTGAGDHARPARAAGPEAENRSGGAESRLEGRLSRPHPHPGRRAGNHPTQQHRRRP